MFDDAMDPTDPVDFGAELDGFLPPVPDAVGLVLEVDAMVSVFVAQRLVRVDGLRREALADAERYGGGLAEVVYRSVRLELAAAMRITEYAAGELLRLSEALVDRYPVVLDSLGGARMTERHATHLVDEFDRLEPDLRESLLPAAVELAEAQPFGSFRRALRTLIDTARAATQSERYEQALTKRRVVPQRGEDGMGWLLLHAPEVEIRAIYDRATAIAKVLQRQDGETRTLDQVRADVLCDLLIDGDTALHPKKARGIQATVAVTVPVLSLLGSEIEGAEPPVVEGIGPIPMKRARELAGTASGFLRILTDPETGMVLSVSRRQYQTPASLRRLVQWRAGRCMAPGCGTLASRCDIDHSLAWEHGGHTSLTNTCPLCRGHHTLKHHGGWTVHLQADGALEWTSPSGRRYLVPPERKVPVFRPVATADDGQQPPF